MTEVPNHRTVVAVCQTVSAGEFVFCDDGAVFVWFANGEAERVWKECPPVPGTPRAASAILDAPWRAVAKNLGQTLLNTAQWLEDMQKAGTRSPLDFVDINHLRRAYADQCDVHGVTP